MTRDEIIKALQQFIHQFDGRDVGDYFVEDVLEAAADMLEQDEHFAGTGKMLPFTLDELDCLNVGVLGGVPIWIEHRSDKPNLLRWRFSGWQVLWGMEQDHMLLNNDVELDLWDLNKVWRCWKRQPTQEETANAPWEGAK